MYQSYCTTQTLAYRKSCGNPSLVTTLANKDEENIGVSSLAKFTEGRYQ
jgi:hypothetical protein